MACTPHFVLSSLYPEDLTDKVIEWSSNVYGNTLERGLKPQVDIDLQYASFLFVLTKI